VLLAIYYLLVINRFLKPRRISPSSVSAYLPSAARTYARTAHILNKGPLSHTEHREILQLRARARERARAIEQARAIEISGTI